MTETPASARCSFSLFFCAHKISAAKLFFTVILPMFSNFTCVSVFRWARARGRSPIPTWRISSISSSRHSEAGSGIGMPKLFVCSVFFLLLYSSLWEQSSVSDCWWEIFLFVCSQIRFYTWETSVPTETQTLRELRGHLNFCCFSFVKNIIMLVLLYCTILRHICKLTLLLIFFTKKFFS